MYYRYETVIIGHIPRNKLKITHVKFCNLSDFCQGKSSIAAIIYYVTYCIAWKFKMVTAVSANSVATQNSSNSLKP